MSKPLETYRQTLATLDNIGLEKSRTKSREKKAELLAKGKQHLKDAYKLFEGL